MKDQIIHMAFKAAGADFYIADTASEPSRQGGVELALEFATDGEAQEAFQKLSTDGTVLMALEKQFWGTLFGRLQDKFGIRWQITTISQS